MATARFEFRDKIERLATKVYLLWAGLSIGVAFLATPAKFLAPSLGLPVALDIGQRTFRVYNSAIQAGRPPPPSRLHAIYIAAEVLKLRWLLALGFGDLISGPARSHAPSSSRPATSTNIQTWRPS